MQAVSVDGFDIVVKRDDLLRVNLPVEKPEAVALSGNKARKFYYLLAQDCTSYRRLLSYGSAQGNGLVALAAIAKIKGLAFDYYVDHISDFLYQQPAGNYQLALDLGANISPLNLKASKSNVTLQGYVEGNILPDVDDGLYVAEGGNNHHCAMGVYQLADEICQWFALQDLAQLKVMLPSGTGTMAVFLQQRFCQRDLPIEVWTCACVGSGEYLFEQFKRLNQNKHQFPIVLDGQKKYHFGKTYREFWQTWQSVGAQTGIEFDLLYDPLSWLLLLQQLKKYTHPPCVVYLHQGGVLGNKTMLARYRRKYT